MLAADSLTKIALFPIPGMVSFPGTTVPLHVFEPRYRAMIRDCTRDNQLIGVCHTLRQTTDNKRQQSMSEKLSSNQASFEPCHIFSAGYAQVLETTADGRLRVDIEMDARYEIVAELQSVPYKIADCQKISDHELEQQQVSDAEALQRDIHSILKNIFASQSPEAEKHLDLDSWLTLSPSAYSFQIFSVLKFDGDPMQSILEMRDPLQRLQKIAEIFSKEKPT